MHEAGAEKEQRGEPAQCRSNFFHASILRILGWAEKSRCGSRVYMLRLRTTLEVAASGTDARRDSRKLACIAEALGKNLAA